MFLNAKVRQRGGRVPRHKATAVAELNAKVRSG
jgi:hypothetical protein